VLAIVLCVLVASSLALPFDGVLRARWQSYKLRFEKSYSATEDQRRFTIFVDNLIQIERLNALHTAANYGENAFTDMTPTEFRNTHLGFRPTEARPTHALPPISVRSIPTSFNWTAQGAVTGVYNQGQCGSCWAFSATEQIESMVYLKHKPTPIQHLSMQQIVDCDTKDGGCNGGDTVTAYEYVIKCGGLENDTSYGPYTAKNGKCKFDAKKVVAKISAWNYVTTPKQKNETQMLYYVAETGPVSICVDASSWQYYTSGVIQKGCSNSLDHCVQITGYGTDSKLNVPYWLIRNSWGTDWGMNGYLMVERNKDLCGVADEVTTVTAV